MPEKPNIFIAIPAYGGSVKNECMMSVIRMTIEFARTGISYNVQVLDLAGIHLARNLFASFVAQEEQFTHLAFVDYDMTFQPTAFTRMLEADKDIIGCMCPHRTLDLNAALDAARHVDNAAAIAKASKFVARGWVNKNGSPLIPLDGVGTGLMLIKRDALIRMIATKQIRVQEQHTYRSNGLTGPLYGFFDAIFDGPNELTEDFSFCIRYRKLCGGQVFAILDEDIGHIGEFTYRAKMSDLIR